MMMMGLKTRSFQELNSRNQEELSRLLELALLPLNHYPCLLFVFSLILWSWFWIFSHPPVDFGLVCASCQCQVQEVVLSADIRCSECQKRVADMMSKLNGEISVYGFLLSYLISSSCFTIALGCFSEHLARGIFEPVLPHAVLLPAKK